MIETITYRDKKYPKFQAEGFAAQFAHPFALQVCTGTGYDIGCNRKEWSLPGSIPVDPVIDSRFDALNLPYDGQVDYIFSSHCLEHIPGDWFGVLEHWKKQLKLNGTLFLYLPDYMQEYWRPWNNRKHVHVFTPDVMKDAFEHLGFRDVFVSGVDLNSSFTIMGRV